MSKMKTGAILCAGAILLSCCAPTQAQDMKFLMTFVGNTTSNNANGSLISVPMTEQAWLNDSARFGGRSTTRGMAVVYHVNADSLGDSIEVIDTKTGEVLNKMFSLYFGEDSSLGRTGITNAVGTKVKKIHYVYTYQNSHSVGAAILAESFYKNANGDTTNAYIHGQMNYLLLRDDNYNLQICNGLIATGRRIQ